MSIEESKLKNKIKEILSENPNEKIDEKKEVERKKH